MIATASAPGFLDILRAEQLIAIVRAENSDQAVATGKQLVGAGIRLIEVSLNTPGALEAIAELASCTTPSPTLVGAGTVLDASDVLKIRDAGATFFVSPVLDRAAIDAAKECAVAAVPGCATPTEMLAAHLAGAAAIKVFPATLWTPDGLANVLRAMPFLNLVPTGGVTVENAYSWLAVGSVAVGIGSGLTAGEGAVVQLRRAMSARTS